MFFGLKIFFFSSLSISPEIGKMMGRRRALLYLKRLKATNPKPSPSSPSTQSSVTSHLTKTSSSSSSSLARFLSTNLAAAAVYDGYDCNSVTSHHHPQQQQSPRDRDGEDEEEEAVRYIPVKAYFLSTRYG